MRQRAEHAERHHLLAGALPGADRLDQTSIGQRKLARGQGPLCGAGQLQHQQGPCHAGDLARIAPPSAQEAGARGAGCSLAHHLACRQKPVARRLPRSGQHDLLRLAILEQHRSRAHRRTAGKHCKAQRRASALPQPDAGQPRHRGKAEGRLCQRLGAQRRHQRGDEIGGKSQSGRVIGQQTRQRTVRSQRLARAIGRQRRHHRRRVRPCAPRGQRRIDLGLRSRFAPQPRDCGMGLHRRTLPAADQSTRSGGKTS